MTTNVLQIDALVGGYDDARVLHGVDLAVPQGKVVAVLGRNGMGKTTLMHTIMGLVPASSGSVLLDGHDVSAMPTHEVARRGLRIVPQGRRVFTSLTVAENLSVSAPRAKDDRGWNVERVYDVFPSLAQRRANRADRLSGGEQEMLAMARALLGDPKVLLLDEPSDGLAPKVVETVGGVLADLRAEGLSAVLVEQNLRLAVAVADEICCMVRGRVAWHGTTDEFRRSPEVAARHLGAGAGDAEHPAGPASHTI